MTKRITVKIVWQVEDVLNCYPNLTKKQGGKILDRMRNYINGYIEHGHEVMASCVEEMNILHITLPFVC